MGLNKFWRGVELEVEYYIFFWFDYRELCDYF